MILSFAALAVEDDASTFSDGRGGIAKVDGRSPLTSPNSHPLCAEGEALEPQTPTG